MTIKSKLKKPASIWLSPRAPTIARRDCHQQRQNAIGYNHNQVHAKNLYTAATDGLHDANLAFLLGQESRNRIDDQEDAQEKRQYPQDAHQQQHALQDFVHRNLPGVKSQRLPGIV